MKTRNRKNLILGVGNILLKDEGIGIHILNILKERFFNGSEKYDLVDCGTASFSNILFSKEYERIFIIDAVRAGGHPGSLYRFKPEDFDSSEVHIYKSAHDFNLMDSFKILKLLRKETQKITIYGIEPHDISTGIELSNILKNKISQIAQKIFDDIISKENSQRFFLFF